jgi:hypothetical protein
MQFSLFFCMTFRNISFVNCYLNENIPIPNYCKTNVSTKDFWVKTKDGNPKFSKNCSLCKVSFVAKVVGY